MANHKSVTNKSKHVAIKFRFCSQCVRDGHVKVSYVKTDNQLADILTKPLEQPKFTASVPKLLGASTVNFSSPQWMSPSYDEMAIQSREDKSFASFKTYVATHNTSLHKCTCNVE